jgi:hypothetical protein
MIFLRFLKDLFFKIYFTIEVIATEVMFLIYFGKFILVFYRFILVFSLLLSKFILPLHYQTNKHYLITYQNINTMYSISKIINGKDCSLVEDCYGAAILLIDGKPLVVLNTNYINPEFIRSMETEGFKRTDAKHFSRNKSGNFAGEVIGVHHHGHYSEMKLEDLTIYYKDENGVLRFRRPEYFTEFFAQNM